MSPRTPAPHDAPRGPIRHTRLIAAAVPVVAAIAVCLPAGASASNGKCATAGKSADHKPAGVGGGRRVR